MEELIRKMVRDLREQAEEKLPEAGEVGVIRSEFENPDGGYCATTYILKINQPPKELDEMQRERYLELYAYHRPSSYAAGSVMLFGYTKDILARLRDEDGLVAEIRETIHNLDRNLEDSLWEVRWEG